MKIIECIVQQHEIGLVLIAALICTVACFTTFNMLSRGEAASRLPRWAWRFGAALVFGGGVFSTHFVAELAYHPGVLVAYEVSTTLLSLVIACSGAAITILLYTWRQSQRWSIVSGLLLGATIAAMYLTGMHAIRLPGSILFDPRYMAASVLTGVLLSIIGFSAAQNLRELGSRLSGAFCLLLAILGQHFIAMAGVSAIPGPERLLGPEVWGSGPLAVFVATITSAILLLSFFGTVFDQHLESKRAQAQIRYLAHHDGLTGLPNRILLNERIAHALEAARRSGAGIAVLCVDLDRFKFVNDLLGHDGGDRLLIEAAERLRGNVRGSDTVARLGGDEFAVVQTLKHNPRTEAENLAKRIVRHFAMPFEVQGNQIECGASIGVAIYPDDGSTGAVLLKNADTALYRAKQDGRGRYCLFEPEMDLRMQQRRALEQDLRHAIERGEMQLHYQPLFDCSSGQLDGFEALLRWTHPKHGPIPPDKFIPLAEECGLISSIGTWVLKTACAEAVSWQQALRVAVNMSPAQFRQGDLPAIVAEILGSTGLSPHRLELEVTEGLLISDSEGALKILQALKDLGVRISLDDFGTGYSSLSYLLRFPFDKLKIDKSFVQALGTDTGATSIVAAILALGQSLNLSITAEGVETEQQLRMLQEQCCDQVQGFLLGKPITPNLLFTIVNARAGRVSAPSGASAASGPVDAI
jgi:diguanylate cyclase (GGDEF)-like protein